MQSHLETEIARLVLTDRAVEQGIVEWAHGFLKRRSHNSPGDGGLASRIWQGVHEAAVDRLGRFHYNRLQLALQKMRWPDRSPLGPGGGSGGALESALTVLSGRFLTFYGGEVALRFDRLLDAQVLMRQVEISQLVAFYWTHGASRPSASPHALSSEELRRRASGPLIPPVDLPLVEQLAQRGLVDVHRHMNISTLSLPLWMKHVLGEVDLPADLVERLPGGQVVQRIRWARLLRRGLVKIVRGTLCAPDDLLMRLAAVIFDRGSLLSGLDAPFGPVLTPTASGSWGASPVWERLGDERGDPAAWERMLMNRAFERLRDPNVSPVVLAAVHLYCLLQNWFAGQVQQPSTGAKGLDRFVEHYAVNPLRKPADREGPARLVQAYQTGAVHWLEARITPSNGARGKLMRLIDSALQRGTSTVSRLLHEPLEVRRPGDVAADRSLADMVLRPTKDLAIPGVGVIFHFVKRHRRPDWRARLSGGLLGLLEGRLPAHPSPAGQRSLSVRFHEERAQAWEHAAEIADLSHDPDVGPLLLGMDICGSETAQGIEVFTPHLRYLRHARQHGFAGSRESVIRRWLRPADAPVGHLPLTCHAGEDFDHILSGLRHIDEAITYLQLERGDRVGHGTALGVDPVVWAELTGSETHVRVGEWLDDLVWFHHWLAGLTDHGEVRRDVERQIYIYSARVYAEHVTPADLHHAWCWRSEDPLVAAEVGLFQTGHLRDVMPDAEDALRRISATALVAHRRFCADSLREQLHKADPCIERGFGLWADFHRRVATRDMWDQVESVSIPDSWLSAIVAVQELLTRRMIDRCVVIEINPSSNLTIGPLRDLTEHPVFRWLDPVTPDFGGLAAPFVVVGTDDPSAFCTELAHEYAALARAAELRGANPRQIQRWLSNLRATGIAYSFFPRRVFEGARYTE